MERWDARVVLLRVQKETTEEERRRALIEEYTDVIHCALVLDLEMDLDQIRKKTERWMRRLGIGEEDEH